MYLKVLPKGTRAVFEPLTMLVNQQKFILAGGTGLALQIGHRWSVDYDFFIEQDFDTTELIRNLSRIGKIKIVRQDTNTVVCELKGVLVSFFRYWDRFLFEPTILEPFRIADPRDIALMKIIAIANRGTRKDFVDLHFLLKKFITLEEIFTLLKKKLKHITYDAHHLLKSLNYFDDAEKDPMPKMLIPLQWNDVKSNLRREFAKFVSH